MTTNTINYEPRTWTIEQVKIGEEYDELKQLLTPEDDTKLFSCGSTSQYATDYIKRKGSNEGLFFFDVEQMYMDLDKTYGQMAFGLLTAPWRNYPEGSLIYVIALGVLEGYFTVGISRSV